MLSDEEPQLYPKVIVDESYIRDRVRESHKRDKATCSCGSRFPETLGEDRLEKLFESHLDYTAKVLLNIKDYTP